MRLRLILLGKTRRPELRAVFDDYIKRISRSSPIEVNEVLGERQRDAGTALTECRVRDRILSELRHERDTHPIRQ